MASKEVADFMTRYTELMRANTRRIADVNRRLDEMALSRLQKEPRVFVSSMFEFVDKPLHHRVCYAAFCQQWVVVAWCMLIGAEK